ncbi:MAG: glycerol-3-phosphate 1-O-acyltransferase PlsY [Bacillota bacterium]
MNIIFAIFCGYLLGSIPFGYLVVQKLKGLDIRKHGSGNTGFTNVYRIAGLLPGLIVLMGDLGKGVVAVLIGQWFGGEWAGVICGLTSMLGHNWSIFLNFTGGRGVATGAGVFFALAPKVLLITSLIWITVIILTKYVSLGSIMGAISVPILMLIFHESALLTSFGLVAAGFVIYRHLPNIKRLLAGTEYKFGQKHH